VYHDTIKAFSLNATLIFTLIIIIIIMLRHRVCVPQDTARIRCFAGECDVKEVFMCVFQVDEVEVDSSRKIEDFCHDKHSVYAKCLLVVTAVH